MKNCKPANKDNFLHIGNSSTTWIPVLGNGKTPITKIICELEDVKLIERLPRDIIELQQEKLHQLNRNSKAFDGELLALSRYSIMNQSDIRITLVPSKFSVFMATVLSLDNRLKEDGKEYTLRDKYLKYQQPKVPIPFLANNFGIGMAILTNDDQMLFVQRSGNSISRPNQIDIGLLEGMDPNRDRLQKTSLFDIHKVVIEGAREELGIRIRKEDITFLSFGVDWKYYQWNLLGYIQCNYSFNQIVKKKNQCSTENWEIKSLYYVDLVLDQIMEFMDENKIWSLGKAAVYYTLVNLLGYETVRDSLRKLYAIK